MGWKRDLASSIGNLQSRGTGTRVSLPRATAAGGEDCEPDDKGGDGGGLRLLSADRRAVTRPSVLCM